MQQMVGSFASPIRNDSQVSTEASVAETATEVSTTTAEPPPTPPSRDMYYGYPETFKLKYFIINQRLDKKLRNKIPTALWNTTAENLTDACEKYLNENLRSAASKNAKSAQSTGCAVSYVCDVQENKHRFPAILIKAKCEEESHCMDSFHTGVGIIDGSHGNCQAHPYSRISFLEFVPDSPESGQGSEQSGNWVKKWDSVPTNCQCLAK